MTRVAVDIDSLAAFVDEVARAEDELGHAHDEVDARMRALHTSWQGEAATAQAAAHERWRAGAQQLEQALAVLRSIARTAHGNYAGAVAANRQMWSD